MQELWRRWPKEYNDTVKGVADNAADFSISAHVSMFMDELGFGINARTNPSVAEVHTNEPFTKSEFVPIVCDGWKSKRVTWLQVQGDGISDEYHKKKWPPWQDLPIRSPQGDIRWAWMAMTEKFWPTPSVHEKYPFGDSYYHDLKLAEDGEKICPGPH